MRDLHFTCRDLSPDPSAAVPTLRLRLQIREPDGEAVHTLALRCQLLIEPHGREYTDREAGLLVHLFGDRSRWSESLRPVPWVNVSTVVGPFTGSTEVELSVPCSYDLEVAAGKYLHVLSDGEVPLRLLFSGTGFVGQQGRVQVMPVPWHCEASYRMPVRVWRELMDRYFPGSGWLRLRRETIDALLRYTSARALPDWDSALRGLLEEGTVAPAPTGVTSPTHTEEVGS